MRISDWSSDGCSSDLLGDDALLCLPTAPGIAPLCESNAEELVAHRSGVLSLTSIAGLARLPEVTLPLARVSGCPLGLSLVGPAGADEDLLAFAEAFCATEERLDRSEEHTSALQSLMRNSYAVFCLKNTPHH